MHLGFNLILVLCLGMFVMRGHAFIRRITRAAGHRILSLKCATGREATAETPSGGRFPLGGPELPRADTDIYSAQPGKVGLEEREGWDIAAFAGWLHSCDLTVLKADKYARLLYCDHDVANKRALGRRVGREGGFLALAGVAAEDAEGIRVRLQREGLVAQWLVAPEGTGQRIWDAAKKGDMVALGPLVQEWSGNDVLNWANRDEFYDEDDDCDRRGYDTPLMIGSREGKVEAVQLLLATPGIDVNKQNDYYHSAILLAVQTGHTEVVRALLAAPGIDVNTKDRDRRTPIMIAAADGHTEIVRILLAAPGIDVNKEDGGGEMAIMLAAFWGRTEILKVLLAAPGIDVNKANEDGWTAIMHAAYNGHTEIVRLLLTAPCIDVNTTDEYGGTAIMWAAYNGHTEIVRALLAAPGIDVDKANVYGETPIMRAVDKNHIEVVRALLAAPGIDVNKANEYSKTPIMRAVGKNHIEVVRALLAAPGIDVNKRTTDEGKTALGLATLTVKRDSWKMGRHFDQAFEDTMRSKAEIAAMLRAAGARE